MTPSVATSNIGCKQLTEQRDDLAIGLLMTRDSITPLEAIHMAIEMMNLLQEYTYEKGNIHELESNP